MKKIMSTECNNCIVTYYKRYNKEGFKVRHKYTNRTINCSSFKEAFETTKILEREFHTQEISYYMEVN